MNKQEGEEATWRKDSCEREYTCNYSDLQRRALKAVPNIVSSLITRRQVLLQTVPSRRTFVQYDHIFEQRSTLMSKRSQNARQFFVNKKTKPPLIKALQTQKPPPVLTAEHLTAVLTANRGLHFCAQQHRPRLQRGPRAAKNKGLVWERDPQGVICVLLSLVWGLWSAAGTDKAGSCGDGPARSWQHGQQCSLWAQQRRSFPTTAHRWESVDQGCILMLLRCFFLLLFYFLFRPPCSLIKKTLEGKDRVVPMARLPTLWKPYLFLLFWLHSSLQNFQKREQCF